MNKIKINLYCYVMKKINSHHASKTKTNKLSFNKVQTKTKAKVRDKKFNPLEYLNSLIDEIHDNKCQTIRKKSACNKRDLNSALAFTPITQRTISSSKVRSRSAYSQYRKKSVNIKQVMNVGIEHLISDDDNIINFTQVTQQSCDSPGIQQSPAQIKICPLKNKDMAARKIQRAWRNHQTLKMVRKYYQYYKNMFRKQKVKNKVAKEKEVNGYNYEFNINKKQAVSKQFERTLKIRKDTGKTSRRKGINESQKPLNKTLKLNQMQVPKIIDLQQMVSQNITKQLIGRSDIDLSSETKRLNTISVEFKSEEYNSKDLKFVIDLFKSNHELASIQLNSKVDKLCTDYHFIKAEFQDHSDDDSQHDLLVQSLVKYEMQHKNRPSLEIDQSFSHNIFSQMERVLKSKYDLMFCKLDEYKSKGLLSEQEIKHKSQQLQGRLIRQKRLIEECKRQYIKNLNSLKSSMIKLQCDNFIIQKINQKDGKCLHNKLRKCFSAQTIIIKSIIEEISLQNYNIECHQREMFEMKRQILSEANIKNQEFTLQRDQIDVKEVINGICPTSPPSMINANYLTYNESNKSLSCYENNESDNDLRLREELNFQSSNKSEYLISSEKLQIKQEDDYIEDINEFNNSLIEIDQAPAGEQFGSEGQLSKDTDNLSHMRKCSEEIEEIIEKFLIRQMVEEIFLNSSFYNLFKTYIEDAYDFKRIEDRQIMQFLDVDLPKYYESQDKVISKMNQKINPSSKQILKLIRDFEFEIEQYQLVIPQQVFKNYRKNLEECYGLKMKSIKDKEVNLDELDIGIEVMEKIYEREREKKVKKAKYISFERDLKIMYLKSVFNCFNQLLIEAKSNYTFMNGRSSIGPGQLTLAIKQYNCDCDKDLTYRFIDDAKSKIKSFLTNKCQLPVFKHYRQLEAFQRQMSKNLEIQLNQNEFKWVNYMDEVLELWQQISLSLVDLMIAEATLQISALPIFQ